MSHIVAVVSPVDTGILNAGIDELSFSVDSFVYDGSSITFNGEFSEPECTDLDTLVASVVLETAKGNKIREFKLNTTSLLSAGFSHSGILFGLDDKCLIQYLGVKLCETCPCTMWSLDGDQFLEISDVTEFSAFFASGMSRYLSTVQGESVLVKSVLSAVSLEEVEAVVDSRS